MDGMVGYNGQWLSKMKITPCSGCQSRDKMAWDSVRAYQRHVLNVLINWVPHSHVRILATFCIAEWFIVSWWGKRIQGILVSNWLMHFFQWTYFVYAISKGNSYWRNNQIRKGCAKLLYLGNQILGSYP